MLPSNQLDGKMDFLKFLISAYIQHIAEDSRSDGTFCDNMMLDSSLPTIFIVLCVALFTVTCMPQVSRECWKLQRDGTTWQWMQRHACRSDNGTRDREWRKVYRMSFPAFQYLVEELRPFIENPSNDFVREPIDTERAVAMVIHRLASGASPRAIAEMYNTGASTVTKYTKLITNILASNTLLYSKYVAMPTGNRLNKIIRKFSMITGIPNICGAIGGTHIKLHSKPKPSYSPSDYLSCHGFYGVLLQGVCDADKIFWDVCCNAPCGLDDASHLRSSSLWVKMVSGEALLHPKINAFGRSIRPYMVGDRQYPLMPFLMTPFNAGREDAVGENIFDSQLLKAREKIEAAFGIMKNRFKILNNMNTDLRYAAQAVMACCVLHNFCQLAGEPEPDNQMDENPSQLDVAVLLTDETELELQREALDCRRALFWDWFRRCHEQAEQERIAGHLGQFQ